ncbi:zinc-ribbon domain-containing protein [Lactiplantibacillus modestisalitolerans]|uniref:Zinc-ribbon domain-containing protein n=1 Tax=Lactiplantibacillus modestisalitolerans TaxID=1457219 RepID=A0ABV5WRJ4_9LACO|nr:zinc-ribbon domain-containing protein [Lactiplantibacillus modestisalitolerans]
MKHCTNCGQVLKAGAKFCPNCGQAVATPTSQVPTGDADAGSTAVTRATLHSDVTTNDESAANKDVPADHQTAPSHHSTSNGPAIPSSGTTTNQSVAGNAQSQAAASNQTTVNGAVQPTATHVAGQQPQGQPTPRIPAQPASKGHNTLTLPVILVVLAVLVGGWFVKNRLIVSQDQLAANVTKAVQKEDGDLFLKQFSDAEQDMAYSDIGAKSVVKDIHNHSRDSLSEVGRIIVDGQRVAGTKAKYDFNVESKKVLGVFTSYYLTTRRSPIEINDFTGNDGAASVKLEDADNKRLTKQELASGFFPGKYNLDVRSGDAHSEYWVWPSGDGDPIELNLIQ